MNDDELDAMLRNAPRPEPVEKKSPSPRMPVVELVLFAIVAIAAAAWASGVLSRVFGG